MLFDPDDGKSFEEVINKVLERNPDLAAGIDELALVSGKSFDDIVNECLGEGLKRIKDPARLAEMFARIARKQTPFGKDPLLRKASDR